MNSFLHRLLYPVAAGLVLGFQTALAGTLYVSSASTNPASPFGSWETAATGIAQAVSAAADGDEVRV